MTILYAVEKGLYINTTNRCPANCTFCIRNHADGINKGDNLWLEREPTVEEICKELEKTDFSKYEEIVFCGFGEPSERIFDIVEVCKFIGTISSLPVRVDTNGLANLIWQKPMEEYFSVFDVVSISLNGYDKESYQKVTRSKFGEVSFAEMLKFAETVKNHTGKVVLTVVDTIGAEAIEKSRAVAEKIGVNFRVRNYT